MQRIVLDGKITLQDAELTVTKLSAAPEYLEPVILDLKYASDIEIGAGPRIGNAIRRYASLNLDVVVPGPENGKWRGNSAVNWKLFSRSGLGMAIASHAKAIHTLKEYITDEFRNYYLREISNVGQNLVSIKDIHSIATMHAEDLDAFASLFYGYLPKVNVAASAFDHADLRSLVDLCREAILNTKDHACRKPLPTDTRILSYFSLRYYQDIPWISGAVGPFKQYLARLKPNSKPEEMLKNGYLEIIVNDDGVGIPARQSQTEEVYWESKGAEESALIKAMQTGVSIKPLAMDAIIRGDPGYGFSIMADCLRNLRAFASIRSGRYLMVCDGTRTDPFSRAFSINRGQSSSHLGYLPGTLIQAVIPIKSPQSTLGLR